VGVYLFGRKFGDKVSFAWRSSLFASRAVSFIDKIMGYQVGDYFLFGKCNSIFIFIHRRSYKWEC
jgi:hypothetical protein